MEGADKVIVTLGDDGAMFRSNREQLQYMEQVDAFSETPDGTLDFTGAGDSFGAGFMVSYLKNQDMWEAVCNGNTTASLVIQKSGGCTLDRMPDSEKVERRKSVKNDMQYERHQGTLIESVTTSLTK